NGSVTVMWTAPANNGGMAITSYTVTASPGGATASGASSPLVVSGLTNGTAYTFTVTAANSVGTGPASSASPPVTPNVGSPASPTSVRASAAGYSVIRVTWTASAGALTYMVKRSTTSGTETLLQPGITGTSYSDTGVQKGQTYYYVVVAVNGGGASLDSSEVSTTT